jgi:hypothetical protein
MDAFGGSGGGGGVGAVIGPTFNTVHAGNGGPSGKAVSFRELAAGTQLTIFVGTRGDAGVGGVSPTPGTAGTSSYVQSPTESRVCEGFGGGGGQVGSQQGDGSGGTPGGASSDFPFVGGGLIGGTGGVGSGNNGTIGTHGKVIIRY